MARENRPLNSWGMALNGVEGSLKVVCRPTQALVQHARYFDLVPEMRDFARNNYLNAAEVCGAWG